ncbi:MAG: Protein translocase subunit SecY [Candidatus Udaeobacter sp.]|nr:MAG: Protein translocase subunit SecY [Candidatus Udaeobacter sp.]
MRGQTQYMPLKVNYAGVMPIIFAWALLLFPATIVSYGFKNSPIANRIANALSTGWPHYVALAAMISFSVISGSQRSSNRLKSQMT